MKSRLTQQLTQVVLTSIVLLALSIACSPTRSASSSPQATDNATSVPTSPTRIASTNQEKTPCTLNLSAAPIINGLKLGMTTDEVLSLFPGAKDDPAVKPSVSRPPSRFGASSFVLTPPKYSSKEQFAGISHIAFTFLDNRVSNFQVGYNGPAYSHVDKFVEKFAGETALPSVDQWDPYVGLDNLKLLKCAEFEVRVFAGGEGGNLNYVQIQDLEAEKKLKERRKKAREQAGPTPGQ